MNTGPDAVPLYGLDRRVVSPDANAFSAREGLSGVRRQVFFPNGDIYFSLF
jgi:hypothetical protein